MKKIIIFSFLLILFCSSAHAKYGIIPDYNKSEHSEKIETLIKKAQRGDASAQCKLAIRYLQGKNLGSGASVVDKEKAFQWAKAAADQGDARGLFILGSIYHNSPNASDNQYGVRLIRESAEKGHPDAMGALGLLYAVGQIVEQNIRESLNWYNKGIENGNVYSMSSLAGMYEKGFGVQKNLPKAFELYKAAAEKGDISSAVNLARMYEKGIGVQADERKAFELYKYTAENGDNKSNKEAIRLAKKLGIPVEIKKEDYSGVAVLVGILAGSIFSGSEQSNASSTDGASSGLIKIAGYQADSLPGDLKPYNNYDKNCYSFKSSEMRNVCEGSYSSIPPLYKSFMESSSYPCGQLDYKKVGDSIVNSCKQFFDNAGNSSPSRRQKGDWLVYILHGVVPKKY